ncbi:MAG: GTP-binding protein [archaeon]|nr:GTP-binding protein [archaeon]
MIDITLSIWDLGGQERFDIMKEDYFKGTAAIALCFDLIRPDSFAKLDYYLAETRKTAGNIPILLVGNKVDLEENMGEIVLKGEINNWMRINQITDYIRTSAKTGENVKPLFDKLGSLALIDLHEKPRLGEYRKDGIFRFKIILVGDSGVGKTSITHRFIDNKFEGDYKLTVGVDFMKKDLQIDPDSLPEEVLRKITDIKQSQDEILKKGLTEEKKTQIASELSEMFIKKEDELTAGLLGDDITTKNVILFDESSEEEEMEEDQEEGEGDVLSELPTKPWLDVDEPLTDLPAKPPSGPPGGGGFRSPVKPPKKPLKSPPPPKSAHLPPSPAPEPAPSVGSKPIREMVRNEIDKVMDSEKITPADAKKLGERMKDLPLTTEMNGLRKIAPQPKKFSEKFSLEKEKSEIIGESSRDYAIDSDKEIDDSRSGFSYGESPTSRDTVKIKEASKKMGEVSAEIVPTKQDFKKKAKGKAAPRMKPRSKSARRMKGKKMDMEDSFEEMSTISLSKPEEKTIVVEKVLERKTTVFYFKQMNPMTLNKLSVVLSTKKIFEELKNLAIPAERAASDKTLKIEEISPYVNIEPIFPGCLCVPSTLPLDARKDSDTADFQITPLATGVIQEACINVYYKGVLVDKIPTPTKVVKQTTAKISATLTFFLPFFGSYIDELWGSYLNIIPGYETLGFENIVTFLAGMFAAASGFFYYLKRPKEATPVESVPNFPELKNIK